MLPSINVVWMLLGQARGRDRIGGYAAAIQSLSRDTLYAFIRIEHEQVYESTRAT